MTIGTSGPAMRRISAEEMALGIEFALGPHRAVQRHVDAVDARRAVARDCLEEFARKPAPSLGRQQAGAAGPRAV